MFISFQTDACGGNLTYEPQKTQERMLYKMVLLHTCIASESVDGQAIYKIMNACYWIDNKTTECIISIKFGAKIIFPK